MTPRLPTSTIVTALARTCLCPALFCPLIAHAIQPVEVGLQPVHDRIQSVQEDMYAVAEQFGVDRATPAERNSAGHRLVELMSERKALEAEVQQARTMSRSPLIMYATPDKGRK